MTILATQMTQSLFSMGVPVAEKAVRTIAVYVGLVAILRLAGKRDLAQLNSFDLVVLLLLSNVVQNAVIGPDNSLWGGLLGAAILVATNAGVVRLSARHKGLAKLIEGQESVLIRNGEMQTTELKRLGLRETELVAAVHRQGASTISEVAQAKIGPDGTITIVLNESDENATKGDVARIEEMLQQLLARS